MHVCVPPLRPQKADDGTDDDENEAAPRPKKRRPTKTEKKKAVCISLNFTSLNFNLVEIESSWIEGRQFYVLQNIETLTHVFHSC